MEINYMTLVMNWINFAIIAAMVIGIIKGIKEIKKFLNRNKQMDKKLDDILNQLEKSKRD
ncbi:hypothetical protein [Clostridium chromiireducens]|uniref:DUF4083 domain-containing protein n=1 Tax=Clostridium chromiireducens TaxID=225345 RepID=A0A1V4IMS6_9CLOT|nr:hypothetical protein [Clostridium chromiireducens]MVX66843.1 hypothetical protein [Clostridium chromiireducens]OPJ61144.1 hypothetical protein CLCHR_26490 [Clostridium chromiireducens]RII33477.1 hypothetical protein D2A34_17200 [Clostridium chromiireducens]